MIRWCIDGVLILCICVAAAGSATAETWSAALEQKAFQSFEEADAVGARAMGLSASDQRPSEPFEWPGFKCAEPLYGRIYLYALANAGQPLYVSVALDRSGEHGDRYDVLYADANMDGTFGETERFEGKLEQVRGVKDAVNFGVISAPIRDPKHAVPIRIWSNPQVTAQGSRRYQVLYYRPWTYLAGEILIGDSSRAVRVIDANLDGTYAGYGTDMISLGDQRAMTLSRLIQYEGKFLTVDLPADGCRITLADYTGKMGKLAFDVARDAGDVTLMNGLVTSNDGISLPCQTNGKDGFELPEGEYQFSYLYVTCENEGESWRASCRSLPVSVRGQAAAPVKLGKPMRLEVVLSGSAKPGQAETIEYRVRGASDEQYSDFTAVAKATGNSEPRKPKVVIRDAAGDVVQEGTMEPG